VSSIWQRLNRVRLAVQFQTRGVVNAWSGTMKTVVNKVNRSGVYYLMTSVTTDEAKNARSDTWGTVAVLLLLLGVVGLMKLVLTV
jgi:hypothetical protein